MPEKVVVHEDSIARCWWCGTDPLYVAYHDHEWGVPMRNDVRLFEKITLEGFQSGLSWLTILRKRENFRAAFDGFEFEAVARYGARKVTSLLKQRGWSFVGPTTMYAFMQAMGMVNDHLDGCSARAGRLADRKKFSVPT